MKLRAELPSYNAENINKTVKDLYNAYIDLIGKMDHMLRHLEDENIDNVSADKITAGVIKATVEMISAIITGGLIRTDVPPNKRIEFSGNQIRCYNDLNQLNGFVIDGGGERFGDVSFYINGLKALTIYNNITEGFSVFPMNGKSLSIGADGETTVLRGILNFFGNSTFQDAALAEQLTAPVNEAGKIKLFYDGNDLKAVFPDGTIKTFTMT